MRRDILRRFIYVLNPRLSKDLKQSNNKRPLIILVQYQISNWRLQLVPGLVVFLSAYETDGSAYARDICGLGLLDSCSLYSTCT